MSIIRFEVEPGVVSAIYFIIFDLFMLAIVDVVLIHVVSWMYHKRIYKGIPLELRSAEIPGVATSLVGRFFAPPNLFAYFIKIALLACILVVDSSIETEFTRSENKLDLAGTFEYDGSDMAWSSDFRRVVERRWETLRRCNIMNQQKTNITFYTIAFNLAGENKSIPDEVAPVDARVLQINDSTVTCLAEGKVRPEQTRVLAEVVGCSQLKPTTCLNETAIEIKDVELPLLSGREDVVVLPVGTSDVTFTLHRHDDRAPAIFPEYNNPTMMCLRVGFGLNYNLSTLRIFEGCIVLDFDGNNTLVERWDYIRKERTLIRRFPGPMFKGRIDMGLYQRVSVLRNILVDVNWLTFSGLVLADGVVYKPLQLNISRLSESKAYTTVPIYTTVLTILLILAAGAARFAVAFSIGDDLRPRLNTINGVSSVAREENEPTGRSLQSGRGMVIGLTKRDGRGVHFGPLASRDIGIARDRGVHIE